MEEIIYQKTYQDLKQELDTELHKTAEGFVRIGYLLKVARDTDVLEESPYKTVTEFAEAEYGLSSTYVSRFISINDRFSQDGYSDRLDDKYKGYGYAKLTVMLQLPDSMNEELSPSMSKGEIEAVKAEFDAEHQVSDIERIIEGSNPAEHDMSELDDHTQLVYQTILALGEAEPELYEKIAAVDGYEEEREILSVLPLIMVPSDTKVYSIRVIGKGRMMLTCTEDRITIVNSRTGEKDGYTWSEIAAAWEYAGAIEKLPFPNTAIDKWEKRYQKKWPIAPVQEETEQSVREPKKETKKKESKVVKAKPETPEPAPEEYEVEGQMSFEDSCPEIIPATESVCTSEMQTETVADEDTVKSEYPDTVEYERKEVLELLDGLRAEVCKDKITSNSIRELKDNMGYLVTKALSDLAQALWEYEIELPDEEEEDE